MIRSRPYSALPPYQPKFGRQLSEIAESKFLAMPRTESFESDSSASEHEDELLFDDIDGVDAGSSSSSGPSQPSSSQASRNNSLSYPTYSYSYPYAYSKSLGRSSTFDRPTLVTSATTSPKLSTTAQSDTFGTSFEDQPAEYRDFVLMQTRNAVKRQQLSKRQQEKQPASLEAFSLSRSETFVNSELPVSPRSIASSPSGRDSMQSISASALSQKLRALQIATEAKAAVPLSSAAVGKTSLPESSDIDQQLEKALRFAQWSRRGRAGIWEPPAGANKALVELVSQIE